MEHILDLQRDVSDLKEQVEVLKAQMCKRCKPHPMVSLLQTAMDTVKAALATKEGQALLALIIAGLAALGKLLSGGH